MAFSMAKKKEKFLVRCIRYIYNWIWSSLYVPYKAKEIRRKDKISVLFLVSEMSSWKTELLFRAMLCHKKFSPLVGISESLEIPHAEKEVFKYCKTYNYPFICLDSEKSIYSQTHSDIIIYQKPYRSCYSKKHQISWNRRSLFIYVFYAFHTINELWQCRQEIMVNSWQYYFENELSIGKTKEMMRNSGKNIVVTGVPVMDELIQAKEPYEDPWKLKDEKKRIIYAPHCTVGDYHLKGAQYSTFLEYAKFMLEMAEKYKDKICFAFKPHPKLYGNLLKIWGKEKIDAYYNKWATMENSQLELGKYTGLFFHSDAMIHDCGSFTVEYLYTGNPVMYLVKDSHHADNMNEFGKSAFEMHYMGYAKEDIEKFILNVIYGVDGMKDQRQDFLKNQLYPPHGKSACDNIINSILGVEEYK